MKRLVLLLVLGAVAVIAAASLLAARDEPTATVAGADPAHTPPAQTRVVVVSRSMPAPSEPGTTLHGRLEHGRMPHAALHGTVLTDTECTPGFDGVSRCRNEIRLADGRRIVVRHPHDMSRIPCLSPGERVLVRPS